MAMQGTTHRISKRVRAQVFKQLPAGFTGCIAFNPKTYEYVRAENRQAALSLAKRKWMDVRGLVYFFCKQKA